MASSAQLAAAQRNAFIDLTRDDVDSITASTQPVRDQQQEAITVQQNVGAARLPAPTKAFQATNQKTLSVLNQQDMRSSPHMPLSAQPSSSTQPTPHTSCVESQNSLLDHVVLRDILRVLGDSRPHASFSSPNLYASLQVQYLQQISGYQAEQQGRLLVYLEWLTQRLFQRGLSEKHSRLYAQVLEMCKASQVHERFSPSHMLSTPRFICPCPARPVQLQSVLQPAAVCKLKLF